MFSLTPWKRKSEGGALVPGFGPFTRDVDEMVNRFFDNRFWFDDDIWRRAWGFSVEEGQKEAVLRAELPGFDLSEIEVKATGDLLTIYAEHKDEKDGSRYSKVERSLTLPARSDVNNIAATFKNGVLEIHMPRLPEAQPRKVEVKA
jgi:HSP20 family protein